MKTSPSTLRTWFVISVWAYVAYNVVASVVGLLVKLPDLPATHAHTDHLSVGQVLFTDGTIMSPPLVFMLAVVFLLLGSSARHLVVARVCAVLLIVGVGLTAVDEAGGFSNKPHLYSAGKWDLALTVGSIFVVLAALAVISGITWLYTTVRARSVGSP